MSSPQLPEHGQAIHIRQTKIEDDDIRRLGRNHMQRFATGCHPIDRKAFLAQGFAKSGGKRGIILYQKYRHGRILQRIAAPRRTAYIGYRGISASASRISAMRPRSAISRPGRRGAC